MAGFFMQTIEKGDAYKQLRADMEVMGNNYVKAGFPEGQPVGEATKKGSGGKPYSDMSEVARIAAWNEFGTETIPARPFFRNFLDTSHEKIADFKKHLAAEVILGNIVPAKAFELLGLWAKTQIQASIRRMKDPPNAPRTIAAKHSSHPLIDSGQMINSVTHITVSGKIGAGESMAIAK